MVVGGQPLGSSSGETIEVTNPANNQTYATVPSATTDDVDRAVEAAERAFEKWSRTPPSKRAALMQDFADLLQERFDELVKAEAIDSGKPMVGAATPELSHSIEV